VAEAQTAVGSFEPPRYPIRAVPTPDEEIPDKDVAAEFQRELDVLNRQLPTPYKDWRRYRITFGGIELRNFCGYKTMRYRWKLLMREIGVRIWLRDKRGQLLWDTRGGKPAEPMLSDDLPHNPDDWPAWAEPYKPGGPWQSQQLPARYFFDVGKQLWHVEEYIDPDVACEDWAKYRWGRMANGTVIDILGKEPVMGAYVPVMVIQHPEVEGLYATPTAEHLQIIGDAHMLRMSKGHTHRPGAPLGEEAVRDFVERYYKALEMQQQRDEEETGDRIMAVLEARARALADGKTPPTAGEVLGVE
jgi:hypothetical protein